MKPPPTILLLCGVLCLCSADPFFQNVFPRFPSFPSLPALPPLPSLGGLSGGVSSSSFTSSSNGGVFGSFASNVPVFGRHIQSAANFGAAVQVPDHLEGLEETNVESDVDNKDDDDDDDDVNKPEGVQQVSTGLQGFSSSFSSPNTVSHFSSSSSSTSTSTVDGNGKSTSTFTSFHSST